MSLATRKQIDEDNRKNKEKFLNQLKEIQ